MKAARDLPHLAAGTSDEGDAPGSAERRAESDEDPGQVGARARAATAANAESASISTSRRRTLPPRTRILLERLEAIVSPERSTEFLIATGWNLASDAPVDPSVSVLGWVDGPLFLHLVRTLGLDGAAELRAELFLLLGSGPTTHSHRVSQRPTTPAPPPTSTIPAPPDPELIGEARRSRRAPTELEVPCAMSPSDDSES